MFCTVNSSSIFQRNDGRVTMTGAGDTKIRMGIAEEVEEDGTDMKGSIERHVLFAFAFNNHLDASSARRSAG